MNKSMSTQYLSDTHCTLLNNKMKKAFFSRLDKVSLRHWKPSFKIESDSLMEQKPKVAILTPITKAKMMSLRVREINKSTRHKRNDNKTLPISDAVANKKKIQEYLSQPEKKISLPKINKRSISYGDNNKYQTKYIDKIEKNFIEPYIKHQIKPVINHIENKRSKIPFIFKHTKD